MNRTVVDESLQDAHSEYAALRASFQSIQIATINSESVLDASYAPAVLDEQGNFYVYVSELAAHTSNLLQQRQASLMLIEDEGEAAQIFARKRVTFQCVSQLVEPESPLWRDQLERLTDKFGRLVEHLKKMGDFHLIQLAPISGRLVIGFGQAYDVSGKNMDVLSHVGGLSGGHGSSPTK